MYHRQGVEDCYYIKVALSIGIEIRNAPGAAAPPVFTVPLWECDFSTYKYVLMIIIAPLHLIWHPQL